jgi:hypothetical protein
MENELSFARTPKSSRSSKLTYTVAVITDKNYAFATWWCEGDLFTWTICGFAQNSREFRKRSVKQDSVIPLVHIIKYPILWSTPNVYLANKNGQSCPIWCFCGGRVPDFGTGGSGIEFQLSRCPWARHLTRLASLTQEYKWVVVITGEVACDGPAHPGGVVPLVAQC